MEITAGDLPGSGGAKYEKNCFRELTPEKFGSRILIV
jgi:hypothetical protein